MILNSLKTILKFTFYVEIKYTMQQHWKIQQLNKTKQKKILQMIIFHILLWSTIHENVFKKWPFLHY